MDRAYASLEIKAPEQDAGGKRTFTGIASTISTDRMDDIVLPMGAKYKVPFPLLWQHNSRQPIGWVRDVRLSKTKIEVDCEVHNEPEPGELKKELDKAWQTIRAQLVRGLSIGFRTLKSARIEGSYGSEIQEWDWLELSPVTIAANADCSITAIKSADQALLRALSGTAGGHIVRLDPLAQASSPGVPGATRRKGVVYLNATPEGNVK